MHVENPHTPPGPVQVGLLVPQTGPIGMFGPSMINSAQIAVDDLNLAGGLLGRDIDLLVGEGGGSEQDIVKEAERLIGQGAAAIIGSHTSPNRQALVRSIGGRLPYVYTTMYEGGEHSFGVFISGETPDQGLFPLIQWLTKNKAARRWYIVGSNYVFPRKSAEFAHAYVDRLGGQVVGEEFLPLQQTDYSETLARIQEASPDVVLLYLIGNDGVYFNRQFSRLGLMDRIMRGSPVACENTLLGIGPSATRNLYLASSYDPAQRSNQGAWLRDRYKHRFGPSAPVVTHHTAALYDGILLFAELVRQARSLDLLDLQNVSEGLVFDGTRGTSVMRDNHLSANAHIVQAEGCALRVLEAVGQDSFNPLGVHI